MTVSSTTPYTTTSYTNTHYTQEVETEWTFPLQRAKQTGQALLGVFKGKPISDYELAPAKNFLTYGGVSALWLGLLPQLRHTSNLKLSPIAGLVTGLSMMALGPKLIHEAIRLRTGFKLRQTYQNNRGEIYRYSDRPQNIPFHIIPNEQKQQVSLQFNLAHNKSRPKNIERIIQQTAVQANVYWTLISGLLAAPASLLMAEFCHPFEEQFWQRLDYGKNRLKENISRILPARLWKKPEPANGFLQKPKPKTTVSTSQKYHEAQITKAYEATLKSLIHETGFLEEYTKQKPSETKKMLDGDDFKLFLKTFKKVIKNKRYRHKENRIKIMTETTLSQIQKDLLDISSNSPDKLPIDFPDSLAEIKKFLPESSHPKASFSNRAVIQKQRESVIKPFVSAFGIRKKEFDKTLFKKLFKTNPFLKKEILRTLKTELRQIRWRRDIWRYMLFPSIVPVVLLFAVMFGFPYQAKPDVPKKPLLQKLKEKLADSDLLAKILP